MKEPGGLRMVRIQDVAIITAQGDYTELQLLSGGSVLCERPMRIWETVLEHGALLRVHRSHFVQVAQVRALHKRGHGGDVEVRLAEGTRTVPVSRAFRAELEARLTAVSR